jgi:hypothetical protein
MSSAILYLAIVAIWACVLIPRWLKRDSARGSAAPHDGAAAPAHPADTGVLGDTPGDADASDHADAAADSGGGVSRTRWAGAPVTEPLTVAESRRRMLAARRRLLLMLIGLEIAAIVLAVSGLAAVWVVIPPTIMLGGYLLLLREAAQADAEQAQREAEAADRAAERARSRARRMAEQATPPHGVSTAGVPAAAAALAAKFAAAPVPADYDDAPGRDFAPGLAGKYTTSNSAAEDDDHYDGYQPPRLRAVGD